MKLGWISGILAILTLQVQMSQRILTPNGDGINDVIDFQVTDVQTTSAEANVLSIQGRRVASLGQTAQGHFVWNGKDAQGRIVESGTYIVQISQGPSRWNGVVAVMK